jgi:hypothetical protein
MKYSEQKSSRWSIWSDEVELTGSMKAAAEGNPNLGFSKWTLVFILRVK